VPPYVADHFVREQPFVVARKCYQPASACIGTQVIDGKAVTDVLARKAGAAASGSITMFGPHTSQTIERQARRSVVDDWPGEQVGAEF